MIGKESLKSTRPRIERSMQVPHHALSGFRRTGPPTHGPCCPRVSSLPSLQRNISLLNVLLYARRCSYLFIVTTKNMFARACWSCWCKSREEAHGCTTTFLTKLFDAELDFDQALAQAEEWGEEEFNVDKKFTDKGCDSILRNEDVFCDAGPSTPSSSGRKAHTSSAGIGKSDAGEPAEKKRRISSKQSVASSPSGSSTQSSSSLSNLRALPFRRADGYSKAVAEPLAASVEEFRHAGHRRELRGREESSGEAGRLLGGHQRCSESALSRISRQVPEVSRTEPQSGDSPRFHQA